MTGSAHAPNVYTIPSGEPFLETLARAVMDGRLPRAGSPRPDPVALSDYRILLPTRRGVRALADSFLRASGGVQLLPRMTPLGDVDEDELFLSDVAGGMEGPGSLAIKPAISQLERRLILTRLILAWTPEDPSRARPMVETPAQAALLAADLARLIDMFDTEQIGWNDLEDLVDREFSSHWYDALAFLNLIRETLPDLLETRGVMNPMARRNLLLQAEAMRLQDDAGDHPVIAAGSTGSIPATANLLRVVAELPNGALVLPGLDTHLDDDAWAVIGPAHPQYGLKQLLERLGIVRSDVQVLSTAAPERGGTPRTRFLSEVMRPADASDQWGETIASLDGDQLGEAVDGLKRITAPTQRDEALAVALVMRHALDEPERTVALVTPDRNLARRVSAELSRWDLSVDDSAGTPLTGTANGTFVSLLVETVAGGFAPVPLLAWLKHPLTALGREPQEVRKLAGLLEIACLRGLTPKGGLAGIARAVERFRDKDATGAGYAHPAVRAISDREWDQLAGFIHELGDRLEPLAGLYSAAQTAKPGPLIRAHVACAEAAARRVAGDPDASELWQGEAGEALAGFFASLFEAEALLPEMAPADYAAFLGTLMMGAVVRARYGQHPRLNIWGLLEARLMQADVVILGGLAERVWPPQSTTDAWLNRPMRTGLGLEPPERRIGLTAHDFVQAASARQVYLTMSEKVDGSPSVPSRWLLRLDALTDGLKARSPLEDGQWVSWALGFDHTDDYRPAGMPKPRPPVGARPRSMSVTQVETWIRDPYAVFARRVLGLEPLPPLAGDPSAADRGTIIHEILHRAVRGGETPDEAQLLEIGRQVFGEYIDYPDVAAFWWPRFERIARWIVEQGLLKNGAIAGRYTETSGHLTVPASGGAFELRARADRIDLSASGEAVIFDYKTGAPPTEAQVSSGLAPQMPLEAAIAMGGGFEDMGAVGVSALEFIRLSGGEPPGEVRRLGKKTPAELAAEALDGLRRRIDAFDREKTPYLPRETVELERRTYDYDHLARHMEWSRQAGEGS